MSERQRLIALARSPRTVRVLGILASVLAVAAVIAWAGAQPAPSLPSSSGELLALIAALGLYALSTSLRSERWRMLLVGASGRPSRGDCYALTAVGYMLNNVLPARGGDLARAALIAPRSEIGARIALSTVIAERILDAGVIAIAFVLLGYVVLRGIEVPDADALVVAASVALVIVVGIGLTLLVGRRFHPIQRALDYLYPLAESTLRLWSARGAAMVGMTVAIWAVESGTIMAVAASIGEGMEPLEAVYVLAVAALFLLVPAGPAQLGTFDAGVAFGARAVGMGGGPAVSFTLMSRFVFFVPITIVGLILFVARYRSGRGSGLGEGSRA